MQLDREQLEKKIAGTVLQARNYIRAHRQLFMCAAYFGFFSIMMLMSSVTPAAADGASDVANMTTIVGSQSTGAISWFYSVIAIFTAYPLNIVVGIAVVGIVVKKVKKLIPHK